MLVEFGLVFKFECVIGGLCVIDRFLMMMEVFNWGKFNMNGLVLDGCCSMRIASRDTDLSYHKMMDGLVGWMRLRAELELELMSCYRATELLSY